MVTKTTREVAEQLWWWDNMNSLRYLWAMGTVSAQSRSGSDPWGPESISNGHVKSAHPGRSRGGIDWIAPHTLLLRGRSLSAEVSISALRGSLFLWSGLTALICSINCKVNCPPQGVKFRVPGEENFKYTPKNSHCTSYPGDALKKQFFLCKDLCVSNLSFATLFYSTLGYIFFSLRDFMCVYC